MATEILSRVNAVSPAVSASEEASEQTTYVTPRRVYYSEIRNEEADFAGFWLEFGEKRVMLDKPLAFTLEGLDGNDYLTLDLIKKRGIFGAEAIDSRDYDSIPNYKAYSLVRDLKRALAQLGLDDAVQSIKD